MYIIYKYICMHIVLGHGAHFAPASYIHQNPYRHDINNRPENTLKWLGLLERMCCTFNGCECGALLALRIRLCVGFL